MPCDPSFLANIKMFELLNEDDRVALAKVVDELKVPAGHTLFPYPFGLLTMIVSLEAIFLACFVLISQNRQAEKDKVRADIEYEVNIKAELEVAHLHEKTDRLYENVMSRFEKLEKRLA
jgi:CRP/FNR family cyclic AMP-dependent transcriptional regulator